MNAKLILAGSVAALVPVVAVPTALSLSGSSSTKESPELSVSGSPSVEDYPPSPLFPPELRATPMPTKLDNLPLPTGLDYSELLTDVSDDSHNTAEAYAQRLAFREQLQSISKPVKNKLTGFDSSFGYGQIDSKKGNRKEQFNKFVDQTDQLREDSKQLIQDLLSKDEFQNKDLPSIFREGLGLELILDQETSIGYSNFINLSIIRKSEVEAQIEKDKSSASIVRMKERIEPEDIKSFCETPSAGTSHLGMYSSSRKDKEETKEYMFFTYYSYCSKDSYYLNNKLSFDSDVVSSA